MIAPNKKECDRNPFFHMKSIDDLREMTKLNFLDKIKPDQMILMHEDVASVIHEMKRMTDIPPPQPLPLSPVSTARACLSRSASKNKEKAPLPKKARNNEACFREMCATLLLVLVT